MIAVQSGIGHVGTWMGKERNVDQDDRELFGAEPP
jgi:hypothetical protein